MIEIKNKRKPFLVWDIVIMKIDCTFSFLPFAFNISFLGLLNYPPLNLLAILVLI